MRLEGLFVERQPEAVETYVETDPDETVTTPDVAGNHMHGTQADRLRTMIHNPLRPAADSAAGPAGQSNRTATGTDVYPAPRDGLAEETASRTTTPQQDAESDGQRGDEQTSPSTERATLSEVTAA